MTLFCVLALTFLAGRGLARSLGTVRAERQANTFANPFTLLPGKRVIVNPFNGIRRQPAQPTQAQSQNDQPQAQSLTPQNIQSGGLGSNYAPNAGQFPAAEPWMNIGNYGGVNAYGSGFNNGSNVALGWPSGVGYNQGWDVNAVGTNWVQNRTGFGYKPQSVAVHDINTYQGVTAFNSGYQNGTSIQAGINGYDLSNGFVVPVLGQNTVQQANTSSFDLSKFNFNTATKGTYGPLDLTTNQVQFSSPFLGNIIQRGVWNDQFKKATGQEIPGGVMNGAYIPNIPFVG